MSELSSLLNALSKEVGQSDASVTYEVVAAAQRHGVAKLLYDLQRDDGKHNIPTAMSELLLDIARQDTAVELARMLGISQVLRCLNRAGIPVFLLKGSALAYWLYDNTAQRSRCDLDILVPDIACAKRAIAVLEEIGYLLVILSADESAEFEVSLERKLQDGLLRYVTSHWRVLKHARLAAGLTHASLEETAISIHSHECVSRGLDSVQALLHALFHRISNMLSGQHNRQIWLCDVDLLSLHSTEVEWNRLSRLCATLHFVSPCLERLSAKRALLVTQIPEAVECEIESLVRAAPWHLDNTHDQGAMRRSQVAVPSWTRHLGWLRSKARTMSARTTVVLRQFRARRELVWRPQHHVMT